MRHSQRKHNTQLPRRLNRPDVYLVYGKVVTIREACDHYDKVLSIVTCRVSRGMEIHEALFIKPDYSRVGEGDWGGLSNASRDA